MSEEQFQFRVDYAKTARSSCKKCKVKIEKAAMRIAKLKANPFSDEGGLMTEWHHFPCIFETWARARATTKKIESPLDIEHFDTLTDEDKETVTNLIKDFMAKQGDKKTPKKAAPKKTPVKPKQAPAVTPSPVKTNGSTTSLASDTTSTSLTSDTTSASSSNGAGTGPDDRFEVVHYLCKKLSNEPSYNAKTEILKRFLKSGRHGDGYKGSVLNLLKLLIPSINKSVYNVKDKQIIKVLSTVLGVSHDDMAEHLEAGDVAETAAVFLTKSTKLTPLPSSVLTLVEVNEILTELTKITKEDEQIRHFTKFIKRCTPTDLKYIIYLIKKDLRINAREKHLLEALHPTAYSAFQMSHDLEDVVKRCSNANKDPSMNKNAGDMMTVGLQLMTPIRPMLAEACKSVSMALGKCPEGMYSEIKYDGERVQLHKSGDEFQYYSRSLKPVLPHKVDQVKDYVPKAFPGGHSMILDCEVLLVDLNTGKPLPFGTLGVHKKSAFNSACVCLFVFDILLLNGESLVDKPIKKRREILSDAIEEIPNRVVLSEMKFVRTASELAGMIAHVIREGLEGLVLKGVHTVYEPGKRHWLKVKKDYLQGGAMADSADLVVLGGYLGTGNKGGMCSVFLMGCYCTASNTWKTVCKVGNGHDDATLAVISGKLMSTGVKIKGDYNQKPAWLNISRGLMPDYLVKDPLTSPVWEITGAEFSQSSVHTAGGLSIRFPRVTKIRDDKDWQTATDLTRLQDLARTSQEKADFAIQKLMIKEGGGKLTTPQSQTKVKKEEPSSSKTIKREAESSPKPVKSETVTPQKLEPITPQKRSNGSTSSSSKRVKTDLSDIFTSYKIYISPKVENCALLQRYVIGYNGEVCERGEAGVVVSVKRKAGVKEQVRAEWLLESVREGKVMDTQDFFL